MARISHWQAREILDRFKRFSVVLGNEPRVRDSPEYNELCFVLSLFDVDSNAKDRAVELIDRLDQMLTQPLQN